MSPIASILFYIGAALMLLDAGLYSFGALLLPFSVNVSIGCCL